MGLRDRLKEATIKYGSKTMGDVDITTSKAIGRVTKKPIRQRRAITRTRGRSMDSIGTYTTRTGREKQLKPLTPGQARKTERQKARWKTIGHERLEREGLALHAIGGFLIFIGALMFLAGAILIIFTFIAIPGLIFGLILLGIGSSIFSAGSARIKYMVTTPAEAAKISEVEIEKIAEKFLSGQ